MRVACLKSDLLRQRSMKRSAQNLDLSVLDQGDSEMPLSEIGAVATIFRCRKRIPRDV